jgi:hypothetical protein
MQTGKKEEEGEEGGRNLLLHKRFIWPPLHPEKISNDPPIAFTSQQH